MSNNRARKLAKKVAAEPLTELEKAIRAIDLATESANANKERKPCYCLATKHKLNVFAPNCLNCGKIICALEGPGPCTYCGSPVVSIEQQQAMILELKREKAALAKEKAMLTSKRKAKAAVISTAGYASKVGGGLTSSTGAAGGWVDLDHGMHSSSGMTSDEEMEEAKKASLAEAHKERLLEYDRTSARRSHVIDQATDFVLPGDRPNLWLTEEERQRQAAKAKENLEKATAAASGYQRAKVMTIDVVNRRVVVEANSGAHVDKEEDDTVPEPVNIIDQAKSSSISGGDRHGGRGGAFAMNPLLRLGESPTFIPKRMKNAKEAKEKILKIKAENPRLPKLQYDDGSYAALMDDAQTMSSSGADLQEVLASVVEPSCG
ncbi:putative zinc finger motif, C2HC5-type-domain-containing protein [Lobosporangium transversale]|uniref:Putative zinc finger motif, C2HC5-type-domain-containing protein n=1 Tax=Lobosporangium transversale TaxID=64571 RepID=A0A1Y2GSA0_9FUNG|nr:putative zinc finger motif, C2HC5-type-domain-containing protein [Lobosporangium transversale]ORZ20986.1 putative zinc finger motif, C2HC5-type-domain-containing protein [Lobosporangium transversale]|eukprot:XP_021882895.1 putative zinc finger motif, C2HC5-type-domain-containing protein [Lobosporangium transversale]